jgi:GT2 family glycosyltransferase
MTEPVCDLVLLTWDHVEETRPCVESLFQCTDVPSRLLVVDNGSVSPAKEYVESIRAAGAIMEVRLLRNPTNEGYPRGMNRGLRESTAPYVCLLNNDLLFSPGWLSEMLAVARANPSLGVLNPASDTLGYKLRDGQTPAEYARSLQHVKGQWVEMGACVGFCMLITREVKDTVGLMGEHFGMGYFEDTEYCRLAQRAGYRCACAKGAFVHHKENRSFKDTWDNTRQQDAHFARNAELFYATWGKPERQAYVVIPNGELAWLHEETLKYANRDGTIWVMHPQAHPPPYAEHMNIWPRPVPRIGFSLRVLWGILKKKKKFDRLILNHRGLAWIFQQLRWWHRARVELR